MENGRLIAINWDQVDSLAQIGADDGDLLLDQNGVTWMYYIEEGGGCGVLPWKDAAGEFIEWNSEEERIAWSALSNYRDRDETEVPMGEMKQLPAWRDDYEDEDAGLGYWATQKTIGRGGRPGKKRGKKQKNRLRVATCMGSGHQAVRQIMEALDAELVTISDAKGAATERFDRLIVLGGGDINPKLYGEEKRYVTQPPIEWRDQTEAALIARANELGAPMMGICRGHQMIAARHGGSLYQDIEDDARTYMHGAVHDLDKIDARLARRIPSRTVNSYHHQAVKRVPRGFDVLAVSHDGLIESIYRPAGAAHGLPPALGVQFHPESMAFEDGDWLGLFWWFIKEGLA